MATSQWWASESFWRKTAIWVTGGSFVALIFLTMDTIPQISSGSKRVPAYSVINHRIGTGLCLLATGLFCMASAYYVWLRLHLS